MELVAVDSEGVAGIIINNQSAVEDAGFSTPFTIDNRNSTVYYTESGKVFGTPLRSRQDIWVSELHLQEIPAQLQETFQILELQTTLFFRKFYVLQFSPT